MWIAKIKYESKGTLLGPLAQKYKVELQGFPLNHIKERKKLLVHVTGNVFGKERDEFYKEFKQICYQLHTKDNFFVATIPQPKFAELLLNKDIIHIAPTQIFPQGYQIITIGSHKREAIEKLFQTLKKKRNARLLKIKNENVEEVSIVKQRSKLTDKQRDAINLAIKEGYYEVPKKVTIQELAKKSKLAFSTFQVHLRKAESKILTEQKI